MSVTHYNTSETSKTRQLDWEQSKVPFPFNTLTIDRRLQARVDENEKLIDRYTKMLLEDPSFEFDGLIVFQDDRGRNWVADGIHRFKAYRKAERKFIPIQWRKGSFWDAWEYSLSANGKHGLMRSNADKRNSVRKALLEEKYVRRTDPQISRLCSVSAMLVGIIRKEMEDANEIERIEIREDANGRKKKKGMTGKIKPPRSEKEKADVPQLSTNGKPRRKPSADQPLPEQPNHSTPPAYAVVEKIDFHIKEARRLIEQLVGKYQINGIMRTIRREGKQTEGEALLRSWNDDLVFVNDTALDAL